jgi:hypothetical protein
MRPGSGYTRRKLLLDAAESQEGEDLRLLPLELVLLSGSPARLRLAVRRRRGRWRPVFLELPPAVQEEDEAALERLEWVVWGKGDNPPRCPAMLWSWELSEPQPCRVAACAGALGPRLPFPEQLRRKPGGNPWAWWEGRLTAQAFIRQSRRDPSRRVVAAFPTVEEWFNAFPLAQDASYLYHLQWLRAFQTDLARAGVKVTWVRAWAVDREGSLTEPRLVVAREVPRLGRLAPRESVAEVGCQCAERRADPVDGAWHLTLHTALPGSRRADLALLTWRDRQGRPGLRQALWLPRPLAPGSVRRWTEDVTRDIVAGGDELAVCPGLFPLTMCSRCRRPTAVDGWSDPRLGEVAYQLKVTLERTRPPVWRRILVPGSYSLWDLHVAIQDAMGWLDCHLHEFEQLDGERFGLAVYDPYDEEDTCLPDWDVGMAEVFGMSPLLRYRYDPGDGWDHLVELEAILPRDGGNYPRLVDGARACPPEDCGGTDGYGKLCRGEYWEEDAYPEFVPEAFDAGKAVMSDPRARLYDLLSSE